MTQGDIVSNSGFLYDNAHQTSTGHGRPLCEMLKNAFKKKKGEKGDMDKG